MQPHHRQLIATTEAGQQQWTLTTFGRKEPTKDDTKEATKDNEEKEKAITKEKAKEHHNGHSRKDGATKEKETTAMTTVKTTKAKDTKFHTTNEAKAEAKEKVKETTTTAKEKEHATNAAGSATTLQNVNAEWQFGNYVKESLKKITRWKRSTHNYTTTDYADDTGDSWQEPEWDCNQIGGTTMTDLAHQVTTTQPTTSVESTRGWSSDTTQTRTRPTTEMRAGTTTGTTSTRCKTPVNNNIRNNFTTYY